MMYTFFYLDKEGFVPDFELVVCENAFEAQVRAAERLSKRTKPYACEIHENGQLLPCGLVTG